MKPTFSMDAALGAPFALIRRRPLTVLGWGIAMFAAVAAIFAVMFPLFLRLPWNEGDAMMEAYTAELLQLQAAINGLNIIQYLVMLVLANAVRRAVLAPGRRDAFLFMRLSMDEVRVAVVVIATFVSWYVAVLVLILIGFALGVALWSMGEPVAVGVAMIYAVLVLIGAIVGWVRVSLMAPATLILGRFAFAEGWAIARGQVLKLIGMNLLVWLINVLAYLLFLVVVAAILVGGFFGQGLVWPSVVDSPLDLMPLVRPMTIPFLATLPILALSLGFHMSLITAPSIVAARQLLDGVPVPPVTVVADAAVGDGLEPPVA